jgi:hypothetical protein
MSINKLIEGLLEKSESTESVPRNCRSHLQRLVLALFRSENFDVLQASILSISLCHLCSTNILTLLVPFLLRMFARPLTVLYNVTATAVSSAFLCPIYMENQNNCFYGVIRQKHQGPNRLSEPYQNPQMDTVGCNARIGAQWVSRG